VKETGTGESAFWDKVHAIEKTFQDGLEKNVPEDATSALLDLDGTIWKAQQELENAEFISQAREILRDMLALLGTRLSSSPKSEAECLSPIVEQLLELREQFRKQKKWQEADEVRKCLTQANIVIEDTKDGSRWQLKL
jgi:cysteinyl-tRNA synthetase